MAAFNTRSLFVPPPTTFESAEVILEVAEPFNLISLRKSQTGKELMNQNGDWYDRYEWANKSVAAGTYHLRLRTFAELRQPLLPGEVVAPAALVAATLLCIAQSGGLDPLRGGWVSCAEITPFGYPVELGWHLGRLNIVWFRGSGVAWLAAVAA